MHWLLWLLLAVGLGVAEGFTLTLAFGILAGAALVAAVVAGFGGGLVLQLLGFALAGSLGLVIMRPIARLQRRRAPLMREGVDALVGQTAVVLQEVGADGGLIKLAGEEWTARPFDDSHTIPVGAKVEVMQIEGASAVVYPYELLP
ncbi:NfeD family protein [Enemella sp. A6]|uniref:NfeD family protein n=1 Tax=Enemella sp. A6 TaxID=3440152 RepID=UPI003EB97E48